MAHNPPKSRNKKIGQDWRREKKWKWDHVIANCLLVCFILYRFVPLGLFSLSACLPCRLPVCLSFHLSVCLLACSPACLSVLLSFYNYVCLPACLSVFPIAFLSLRLSTCLPACQSDQGYMTLPANQRPERASLSRQCPPPIDLPHLVLHFCNLSFLSTPNFRTGVHSEAKETRETATITKIQ